MYYCQDVVKVSANMTTFIYLFILKSYPTEALNNESKFLTENFEVKGFLLVLHDLIKMCDLRLQYNK